MRVLFGAPLTDDERQQITPVVYNNTITSMKILCAETKSMGYEGDVVARDRLDFILGVDDQSEINDEIGVAIKELWTDPGVLKAWKRRSEYQIVESVKYYFNEIERIMKSDYVATQQDMLLARVRTSGIVTERYVIDGVDFEMYDVGGQRNERKKWIHCFDDVTAVIFVAALSEYDQALFEDSSANRMTEAVDLFGDICNNAAFEQSSMILFLNKKDLYEEKIKEVHIGDQPAFEDFPCELGDADYYDRGVQYFLDKFLARNQSDDRQIYHHATCATDSRNVEVRFVRGSLPFYVIDRRSSLLKTPAGCVQLVQGHHHEEEHGGHGHVKGGPKEEEAAAAPERGPLSRGCRAWQLGSRRGRAGPRGHGLISNVTYCKPALTNLMSFLENDESRSGLPSADAFPIHPGKIGDYKVRLPTTHDE